MKQLLLATLFLNVLFSSNRAKTAYDRLDHKSITKLFSYCKIYHNKKETKLAKNQILSLINKHRQNSPVTCDLDLQMPVILIDQIVTLFQNIEGQKPKLNKSQVDFIQSLTTHLYHNQLKGHSVNNRNDLFSLNNDEIDLARALLIYQYGEDKDTILHYECLLDFMALEILGRLSPDASDEAKIEAINHYIFFEKAFRFPPQSMWTKSSEKFTFLDSVIDSTHGVCLGVSTLYLTLAQRLNVQLDIITPPGHIFLSYKGQDRTNIETTARGIHMPFNHYLNVGLKSLPQRTIKEVVGLNFMNAAAQCWETKQYQSAYDNYKIALNFIQDDPLLNSFIGYICLFLGKKEEGHAFLKQSLKEEPHLLFNNRLASDYLNGFAPIEGIELLFEKETESRQALQQRLTTLKSMCKKHPNFMDAQFALAATLLQLQCPQEALLKLNEYLEKEKLNPTALYYACVLCHERFNSKQARLYFKKLEVLLNKHNHMPSEVNALKRALYPI
jgi:hypothetical protein